MARNSPNFANFRVYFLTLWYVLASLAQLSSKPLSYDKSMCFIFFLSYWGLSRLIKMDSSHHFASAIAVPVTSSLLQASYEKITKDDSPITFTSFIDRSQKH